MEKKKFVHQLVPGQELGDIPGDFDSREVLIGRESQSPFCFVIKDIDQVLPYCVINFTRGPTQEMPTSPGAFTLDLSVPSGVRLFFGSSSSGSFSSTYPVWPPLYVCFLPGKHCVVSTSASGGMTVTLKDSMMANNLNFIQNLETNVRKLVELQIHVILNQSRPNLGVNVRLKTVFHWLQQSDAICCSIKTISKVEAELYTLS